MARPAFGTGGGLGRLGPDSLLFIGDAADGHAQAGRGNGLPKAFGKADGHASGLETAPTAPAGVPAAPDLPDDHGAPDIVVGNLIELIDPFMSAKGGSPGKPTNGGSDGGATGDPGGSTGTVYDDYVAGSSDGDAGYDIWIDFKGSWTAELQQAFIDAANYLVSVIMTDIGGGGLYRGKIIDDIYITAELKAIDGAGGILGQAGPTAIWTANDLTAAGQMQFDIADAEYFLGRGLWDDIVMHEMMHVLGFGTLWDFGSHDLVNGGEYTGPEALAAYRDYMNDQSIAFIPVETDGGSGTAGGHWNEILADYSDDPAGLGNELMTGFIDNDNWLSEFSVMVLADLGYDIQYQDYPGDNYVDGVLIAV